MVWQQCGSVASAPGMIYPQWREKPAPSPLPLPPSLSWGPTARRTYLWTPRGGMRKQGLCPQMTLSRWMAMSRRVHARRGRTQAYTPLLNSSSPFTSPWNVYYWSHHTWMHVCILDTGYWFRSVNWWWGWVNEYTLEGSEILLILFHFYLNILMEASANME